MTFASPQLFWLFVIVLLPLIAFLWWAWRKRCELIGQFVQSRRLAHLTVGISPARQKLRLGLLAGAVGCLIVAIARPQYGSYWEEAPQQGLDIAVAIDTSRSMLAEDVTPNRFARARLAALDLMRHAQGDRLALIPFAGTAFIQCPLTFDRDAFRQNVEALHVGIIPQGGSDLAAAIRAAAGAFDRESENHRVLVLFSDGEEHDSDTLAAAREAAKAGLQIFTVGIGTTEGDLVPLRDERGQLDYLKDNRGNVVKTRLHEALLQEIATAAGGFYIPLRGANPIETLYTRGLAPLPKGEGAIRMVHVPKERYRWPVALALALLLLEMFLPQRRRVRRTELAGTPRTALQQAAVALVVIALPFSAFASPAKALREYRSGNYEAALQEYERRLERKGDDPRVHFNAGNAAFRAGEFHKAAEHFSHAIDSPDLELQQRAFYNLGNALYRLGEPLPDLDQKVETWQQALRSYEYALKLEAEDADARHNAQFVKQQLEEIMPPPPPQQSQPGDEQDENGEPEQEQQDSSPQEGGEATDDSGQDSEPDQTQDTQRPAPESEDNGEEDFTAPADIAEGAETSESPLDPQGDQMTAEQALQLLDSLRDEDRPLIFRPPQEPVARPIKDW